jgi:hypothetical protein
MTDDWRLHSFCSSLRDNGILTTRGKTTEKQNPEQNTLFLDSTVWISEMYQLSFG